MLWFIQTGVKYSLFQWSFSSHLTPQLVIRFTTCHRSYIFKPMLLYRRLDFVRQTALCLCWWLACADNAELPRRRIGAGSWSFNAKLLPVWFHGLKRTILQGRLDIFFFFYVQKVGESCNYQWYIFYHFFIKQHQNIGVISMLIPAEEMTKVWLIVWLVRIFWDTKLQPCIFHEFISRHRAFLKQNAFLEPVKDKKWEFSSENLEDNSV